MKEFAPSALNFDSSLVGSGRSGAGDCVSLPFPVLGSS